MRQVLLAGVTGNVSLQVSDRRGAHAAAQPTYLDSTVFAYLTSDNGLPPPRNATVVNVVSGAANRHNMSPAHAVELAKAAAKRSRSPLDVVLFPECFLYNGDNAEFCGGGDGRNCTGPHARACAAAARSIQSYVVCPIYELAVPNASQMTGPMWNTALLFDRAGAQVGVYRKMFPTSELDPESGEIGTGVLPSSLGVPVFDTDFGRIAIAICWDMEFPEVWQAAAAQGAELLLWPSAGHGGRPVSGYAQIHNLFVASNGDGQFFDRLGQQVAPDVLFNFTLSGDGATGSVPVAIRTLDLDSTVVFYGGPKSKHDRYTAFIDADNGVVEQSNDPVSKWSVVRSVRRGVTVREALRAAGIESRREESTRNRRQVNELRARAQPQPSINLVVNDAQPSLASAIDPDHMQL